MNQCACEIHGRKLILDLEPAEFDWQFTRGTRGERVLILSWRRETQFRNIITLTVVTIRLKLPFIIIVRAVRDLEEDIKEVKSGNSHQN